MATAMRKEYVIAILLFLASFPAGEAVSVAGDNFVFLKDHPALAFYGSILLTAALIIAAIIIALRGEQRAEREGEQNRMLLVVGGSLICAGIICCIWYFATTGTADPRQQESSAIAHLAELGWTVKPGNNDLEFDVAWKPLPPMDKSAIYFRQIKTPFHLFFQGVASFSGLNLISDVAGCYKIESNAGEFTDISDLSRFIHLKSLFISQLPLNGNGVVNLSPLSKLTGLEELSLSNTRVRDAGFLTGLVNLKTLRLDGTLIGDISAVRNMSHLSTFAIRDSRVSDLSPLKSAKLSDLTIDSTQVPALAGIGSVKSLQIIGNKLQNLEPVGRLSDLESLFIWAAPVIDMAPLASLQKLKSLQIAGVVPIGFSVLVVHADALANLLALIL